MGRGSSARRGGGQNDLIPQPKKTSFSFGQECPSKFAGMSWTRRGAHISGHRPGVCGTPGGTNRVHRPASQGFTVVEYRKPSEKDNFAGTLARFLWSSGISENLCVFFFSCAFPAPYHSLRQKSLCIFIAFYCTVGKVEMSAASSSLEHFETRLRESQERTGLSNVTLRSKLQTC